MAVGRLERPRIKPEHQRYRTRDGNIRIGGVIYGAGSEIEDAEGWIWTLTGLTDGTRTADAIVEEVLRRHRDVAAGDVLRALDGLRAAGFLEDAAVPRPRELSEREAERYSRGVPLLRWMDLSPRASAWEAQLTLKRARVLLLGVGGTGGVAAQHLVASGVGHLHCVDGDIVELSNLNRQLLYSEQDIGDFKADAAVARLRRLNSDVHVSGEVREIPSSEDLADLLGPSGAYDLFVLAADRPFGIQRWANRICLEAGMPWVDGGYSGPLVTAGIHRPGTGPCWQCLHDGARGQADLGLAEGVEEEHATPHLPWNPVNAVTAGLSGGLVAHGALSLLTGIPPLEPGFRFSVNLMAPGEEVTLRLGRRSNCPACGADAGGASR